MRKFCLMASATMLAAAAFAAPALAQDQSEEPFTGGYIGGSIGYTVQPNDGREGVSFDTNLDGTYGDPVRTMGGLNAFSPGYCGGFTANNSRAGGCVNDKDDIEYFVRAGGDKQFGSLVVGLVSEFGRSEATDSVTAFSTTPASYTFTRNAEYSASIRGRIGYTPDRTLFYATGGPAWAHIENNFTTTNGANSFTEYGDNDAWGYSAGGGVEQLVGDNFSFGLEYLYTSLKDDDYTVRVGRGTQPLTNPFILVNAAGTDMRRADSDFNTHSMRFTAAFRF